ncbi:hypothetical protein D3C85_734860 [compost metagenome]
MVKSQLKSCVEIGLAFNKTSIPRLRIAAEFTLVALKPVDGAKATDGMMPFLVRLSK